MKTSNKLVLGLSGILAVSVGIGVTATYAWFRISRAANVNITDTTVVGEGSSLTIAYYQLGDDESALLPASATKTSKGFDISAATNTITDISGDGVDFYKPNWDPNAAETEDIAIGFTKVKNTSLKSYYIRFGISFTNSGQSSFDIYFNDGMQGYAADTATRDPALRAEQQQEKRSSRANNTGSPFGMKTTSLARAFGNLTHPKERRTINTVILPRRPTPQRALITFTVNTAQGGHINVKSLAFIAL
jgi:hypothetical protein